MKTLFFTASFLLIQFLSHSQTQSLDWVLTGGSTANDRIHSLVSDQTGALYAGGSFSDSANFNPLGNSFNLVSKGGEDAFLCQYNFNGGLLWAVSFGSSNGSDFIRSITVDQSGNTYATGRFENTVDFDPDTSSALQTANGGEDVFIVKFDYWGNFQWVRTFGGSSNDYGLNIETHPAGMVLVTGYYQGNVDFDPDTSQHIQSGNPGENPFISAFDINGNYLWTNTYKASSNFSNLNRGNGIEVNSQGNILLCGSFVGTTDFDPSNSTLSISSNGREDAFLTCLSPSGSMLWTKTWGGSSECNPIDIKLDHNDNIFICGLFRLTVDFDPSSTSLSKSSNGSRDMFISKFDPSGNLLWNRTAGSFSADVLAEISVDRDGFVFGTGYFYADFDADPDPNQTTLIQNQGNADAFYWELDSAGNYVSAHTIGGSGHDIATGMAFDGYNGILIGGSFSNSVDFDPDTSVNTQTSNGYRDFFIQKISVCKTTNDTIQAYGCQYYISPSSKFFNSPGTYVDTIPNQLGCDSVLTINLTLNQLDTTVVANDPYLIANTNQTVSYQWLDCNNGYAALPGETQSTFMATQNGSYAVEITQGQCKDTSSCYQILSVGLNQITKENKISFHPNPSSGVFTTELPLQYRNANYRVYNLQGKLIKEGSVLGTSTFQLQLNHDSGLYLITFESKAKGLLSTHKLIVN